MSEARERLASLDVFRGITIAAMLVVNNPGTWDAIYAPIEHAEWHGWTGADLIFPFFLWIVGITTWISLESRRAKGASEADVTRQIVRRGAIIFMLGFLFNGFPYFTWTAIPGIADPSFLARVVDRLQHWRFLGVLQRIGLAYVAAALIARRTSPRQQIAIVVTILLGYWALMMAVPVPTEGLSAAAMPTGPNIGAMAIGHPDRTMAAWLDRWLLDWTRFNPGPHNFGNHLWSGSVTWDPEGVLSTLPAIATTMIGILAGRWVTASRPIAERLRGLALGGVAGVAVGVLWGLVFPINKGIWTSSYVIFTAGMACLFLAAIMWMVDVRRVTWWTRPFVIYGMNPILAYVGSQFMARMIYSILEVTLDGKTVKLQTAIYRLGFASWLEPKNASLAFALSVMLLWYGIVYALYRKQIFLKA